MFVHCMFRPVVAGLIQDVIDGSQFDHEIHELLLMYTSMYEPYF